MTTTRSFEFSNPFLFVLDSHTSLTLSPLTIDSFKPLIFFLSAGFLMPVIQNMTKLFYVKKSVINANKITILINSKEILWID